MADDETVTCELMDNTIAITTGRMSTECERGHTGSREALRAINTELEKRRPSSSSPFELTRILSLNLIKYLARCIISAEQGVRKS